MPVKWSPEYDQQLLLKILETHDLKVDARKISAAWPTDRGEVPTPRAITERLVKIRQNAKATGAGHFGISSAQGKDTKRALCSPRTVTTAAATPRQQNSNAQTPPNKRKREDTKDAATKDGRPVQVKRESVDLDGTAEDSIGDEGVSTPPTSASPPSHRPLFKRPPSIDNIGDPTSDSYNHSAYETPTKSLSHLSMHGLDQKSRSQEQSAPSKRRIYENTRPALSPSYGNGTVRCDQSGIDEEEEEMLI